MLCFVVLGTLWNLLCKYQRCCATEHSKLYHVQYEGGNKKNMEHLAGVKHLCKRVQLIYWVIYYTELWPNSRGTCSDIICNSKCQPIRIFDRGKQSKQNSCVSTGGSDIGNFTHPTDFIWLSELRMLMISPISISSMGLFWSHLCDLSVREHASGTNLRN